MNKILAETLELEKGCGRIFQGIRKNTELGDVKFTSMCGREDIFLGLTYCPECKEKAKQLLERADVCECGHERNIHSGGKSNCLVYSKSFDLKLNYCTCKKFKQSPDTIKAINILKEILK